MCYRKIAQLSLAALLVSAATVATAAPVNVGLDFVGPGPNDLNLDATGSGVITTGIEGKIFVPFTGVPLPQTDAIGLNPDTISVISAPAALATNITGGPVTASLEFESSTWTPLSISNVSLDLLNGETPAFALDQLVLETNAPIIPSFIEDPTIKIDVSGVFQSVKFFQGTTPATFGPGNTYAIAGTLVGIVDIDVTFDIWGGGFVLPTALGSQEFETPFTLEGTLGVNTTGPNDANLTFDGVTTGQFNLGDISTTLTADLAGFVVNLSLDVAGGLDLNFDYHLEDTAHVPEPGSLALLGLGALGLVPVLRRRIRTQRSAERD